MTKNEDLRAYRPGKLTILQLMLMLALLGIVATVGLHYFLSK